MKIEIDKEMIEQGYISIRKHPKFDLYIHNYTAKAQYDRVWNGSTLNCRGLILDKEGNTIARPFSKFFNFEEYGKDTNLGELPSYKSFDVFDKLDGSLGIMYTTPEGKVSIATRGSFESEQAIKAQEILKEKYPNVKINPDYTYLFEIIYPENRVVIDYKGEEDLILLTIIENATGKDVQRSKVESFANTYKFPLVKKFIFSNNVDDILNFMKTDPIDNQEGFVIQYDTGLRIKMKYKEYVRLHRIITGVSTKTVWEMLRDGQNLDKLKEKVPDEFNEWLENTVRDLETNYKSVEHSCKVIMNSIHSQHLETRKAIAEYIKEEATKEYQGVCFSMYDEKDYSTIIWKIIKPKAKSFKEEI